MEECLNLESGSVITTGKQFKMIANGITHVCVPVFLVYGIELYLSLRRETTKDPYFKFDTYMYLHICNAAFETHVYYHLS